MVLRGGQVTVRVVRNRHSRQDYGCERNTIKIFHGCNVQVVAMLMLMVLHAAKDWELPTSARGSRISKRSNIASRLLMNQLKCNCSFYFDFKFILLHRLT